MGKRSKDIKCFKCLGFEHIAAQCPNQRIIVTRGACIESEGRSKQDSDSDDSEENDEEEYRPSKLLGKLFLLMGF